MSFFSSSKTNIFSPTLGHGETGVTDERRNFLWALLYIAKAIFARNRSKKQTMYGALPCLFGSKEENKGRMFLGYRGSSILDIILHISSLYNKRLEDIWVSGSTL